MARRASFVKQDDDFVATASISPRVTVPSVVMVDGVSDSELAKSNCPTMAGLLPLASRPPTRAQNLQVIYLAVAFAVLFTAFNVAQTFLTTLHATSGFASLGMVYGTFAVGSLIAPALGPYFGVKRALFCSSIAYVVFVAAAQESTPSWLLLLASAWEGLSGGLMWIFQGVWLALITEQGGSPGYFSGLFFTIFSFNGVAGNAIALIALLNDVDIATLLWMLFVIGAIGSVMIYFMADVKGSERVLQDKRSVSDILRTVRDAMSDPNVWLLSAYFSVQGVGLSFSFGNYPTLLQGDKPLVCGVFLCYGVASCAAAFVSGKVFDKVGARPIVILHVILVIFNFVMIFALTTGGGDSSFSNMPARKALFALGGAVFGVIDNLSNSINNMTIIELFSANSAPLFAGYRFVFCIGFTIAAALSMGLGTITMMVFTFLWLCMAAVCYFWLRIRISNEVTLKALQRAAAPDTPGGFDDAVASSPLPSAPSRTVSGEIELEEV